MRETSNGEQKENVLTLVITMFQSHDLAIPVLAAFAKTSTIMLFENVKR